MADVGCCKFKREPIKSIRIHQTLWKVLDWKWQRRHCAHQKHVKQQNEYYWTYSLNFLQKIFTLTPFEIPNIFTSNCTVITHSFSVTDYNHICFVIKLHNLVTCNLLLPNTGGHRFQFTPCKVWASLNGRNTLLRFPLTGSRTWWTLTAERTELSLQESLPSCFFFACVICFFLLHFSLFTFYLS